MSSDTGTKSEDEQLLRRSLKALTPDQVLEVDQALDSLGPFGEVRLVKVKGRLRFIQQLESRPLLRDDGVPRER